MKVFLVSSLMSFLSVSAFARVMPFQCHSEDQPGIHRFDAHGIVTIDDNNKVQGLISLVTQKAQADQSIQTFDEIRVHGNLKNFSGGDMSTDDLVQLSLESDVPYIKSLDLLLNFEEKNASVAFSIDNFSYRSNCKITDN